MIVAGTAVIDWSATFDESYPAASASEADLQRFVATVSRPMTAAEVSLINCQQRNPFSKDDSLYASWRPFDPSHWMMPSRPLPASYLSFLEWSNGGEFRRGERWFQFFPILDEAHGVRAMLLAYHLPEYMPGALPFALNGGGTFYLFDMRSAAKRGEYPIVASHSGNLGWEADACIQIAKSFDAACGDSANVDELQ